MSSKIHRIEDMQSFKIKCSQCNSENVGKAIEFWLDFEERCTAMDYVIICRDCGNKEKI